MNCKPGDLAVIVKSRRDIAGIGRIVEVVHLVPVDDGTWSWLIKQPMHLPSGTYDSVKDSVLRPIRPSSSPDETLRWKKVPSDEVTQ